MHYGRLWRLRLELMAHGVDGELTILLLSGGGQTLTNCVRDGRWILPAYVDVLALL